MVSALRMDWNKKTGPKPEQAPKMQKNQGMAGQNISCAPPQATVKRSQKMPAYPAYCCTHARQTMI